MQVIEKLKEYENFIRHRHGDESWVTVYKLIPIGDSDEDSGMYCALVAVDSTEQAMSNTGWDIGFGTGGAGFSCTSEDGENKVDYNSNIDDPFLRLVLRREFNGIYENYCEILEEFRLLYNLFYDCSQNIYLDFDDSGEPIQVIKVEENEIKIKRKYLKSFMAVKQMNLVLYFESTWHTNDQINLEKEIKESNWTYSVYCGDSYVKGYSRFLRICGKKLFNCEAVDTCNIWTFEKVKKYQSFIIGGDEDAAIEYTSNPEKLSNYFGKNPEAPHYLTSVFFKNEVMQKYYGSSKYKIQDGYLIKNGIWRLRFDNNSDDHISVFLGDLGRDLPEVEQIYWRSFNILPDGRQISRANFERSFLGNFYDSEKAEHIFKAKFNEFQEYWLKKYGWNFFLPLTEKDTHFFDSIRTLLSNEQSEFDNQILGLAKSTIDSVNIKDLSKFLDVENEKSISLILKLIENSENFDDFQELLRGVQALRSSGVAHRKGTEYEKQIKKYEVLDNNYRHGFNRFLLGFVALFNELMGKSF